MEEVVAVAVVVVVEGPPRGLSATPSLPNKVRVSSNGEEPKDLRSLRDAESLLRLPLPPLEVPEPPVGGLGLPRDST